MTIFNYITEEEYKKFVKAVNKRKTISIRQIMDTLEVNFSVAARIMDHMYENKIVGEPQGDKPRNVL